MLNDMTDLINDVASLRNNYRRVRDEELNIRPRISRERTGAVGDRPRISRDRTGTIRSNGLNLIDPSAYTV